MLWGGGHHFLISVGRGLGWVLSASISGTPVCVSVLYVCCTLSPVSFPLALGSWIKHIKYTILISINLESYCKESQDWIISGTVCITLLISLSLHWQPWKPRKTLILCWAVTMKLTRMISHCTFGEIWPEVLQTELITEILTLGLTRRPFCSWESLNQYSEYSRVNLIPVRYSASSSLGTQIGYEQLKRWVTSRSIYKFMSHTENC